MVFLQLVAFARRRTSLNSCRLQACKHYSSSRSPLPSAIKGILNEQWATAIGSVSKVSVRTWCRRLEGVLLVTRAWALCRCWELFVCCSRENDDQCYLAWWCDSHCSLRRVATTSCGINALLNPTYSNVSYILPYNAVLCKQPVCILLNRALRFTHRVVLVLWKTGTRWNPL